MDTKKHHILEVATQYFMEKGYQQTSVQDIAEGCNISKATLYKLFSSKEEIGLYATLFLTDQLISELQRTMERTDLTPKEKLRESILLRLSYFDQRNGFIDALLVSFMTEKNEKYIPAINRAKFHIFHYFCHIVAQGFQLENDAAAWEITVNLNGLIREVTFFTKTDSVEIDANALTDFIMDSLEAITKQRKGKTSFLTDQQMQKLQQFYSTDDKTFRPIFERNQLLKNLYQELEKYEDIEKRNKLSSAVEVLEQEYQKPSAKNVVVEAILTYLKQEKALETTVVSLEELTLSGRNAPI